jgi:hypothetical protein
MGASTEKPPPASQPRMLRAASGPSSPRWTKAQHPPAHLFLRLCDTLLGESDRLAKAQPPVDIGLEYGVDHTAPHAWGTVLQEPAQCGLAFLGKSTRETGRGI